ncbi:MAG: carbamoyl phosphate synthase large subunit, partial [Bacteroidales bacterium]|nr:carbamoyl phosphate synthase large subunit [Bacteroidales bacterium]
PFVSKVLKTNFIELATKVMTGEHPEALPDSSYDIDYVGVKSSQFSFARLEEADPILGVDMSSTGEVACISKDFDEALLLSLLSVGNNIPSRKVLLSMGDPKQKADLLGACRKLAGCGYALYATCGSWKYLEENNIPVTRALWPSEEENAELKAQYKSALDLVRNREVDMVISIPKDFTQAELSNGYKVRRATIDCNIPLFTNARLATNFIHAFCSMRPSDVEVKPWSEF